MKVLECRVWRGVLVLAVALAGAPALAGPEKDKVLAPYFVVQGGEDSGVETFPLQGTEVQFDISGVTADVTVRQTYRNRGQTPLSAQYVFPASTRAAVHALSMTLGDRVIHAQIKEREQARTTFEAAKRSGKSASLLEQDRPNVFRMNVANILPGELVVVELRYSELLTPTSGVYEFVFPTVVGPRYSTIPVSEATPADAFIQSPYLHEGTTPPATLAISGLVSSSIPLQGLGSDSHRLVVVYASATHATVSLAPEEAQSGNRDFVLRYSLVGRAIQTGLSLYEGGGESFFMLMVQPPKQVSIEQLPPREYTFIIDVSGSMMGFPLATAKVLMKNLAAGLRPQDRFNLLLFSGATRLFSESAVPATAENVSRALDFLQKERGGGGTELRPAILQALGLPHAEGISRTFIVVTDGYISTEKELFQAVRENLGNANVFCFGIGSSVNRFLVDGIARAGLGESFVVLKPSDAALQAQRFLTYVGRPVLTDIHLQAQGFDISDVEPGGIADVLADRPIVVLGKWSGARKGTLRLTGRDGTGEWAQTFDVAAVTPSEANAPIRLAWARERIAGLSDYGDGGDEVKAELVELGLHYNLLTAHTSFVAVSEERRAFSPGREVDQPLPLPEGVEDSAVGGVASGDEPTLTWMAASLLALLALGGAARLSRRGWRSGANRAAA
jgi:Ca-activated chloride channel family protein